MEYYVTTPDGEKGPYSEETIQGWLREGKILHDAPVRRANEMGSLPVSSVFPTEASKAPSTTVPSDDVENVYAPPKVISESIDPVFIDPGSFGSGFAFGLFCGCAAFLFSQWSESMGSETKRGVKIGFATHIVLGAIFKIVKEIARALWNAYL